MAVVSLEAARVSHKTGSLHFVSPLSFLLDIAPIATYTGKVTFY